MLIKEATATFIYTVGSLQGEVTVGAKSSVGRSEDDWKINLALDAGRKIAADHNTDLEKVALSLKCFSAK